MKIEIGWEIKLDIHRDKEYDIHLDKKRTSHHLFLLTTSRGHFSFIKCQILEYHSRMHQGLLIQAVEKLKLFHKN
jgi:hypothetical protein